jgi:hypothetical protein
MGVGWVRSDCLKLLIGKTLAPVAQGIEHRFPKPRVAGSNPAGRTWWIRTCGDELNSDSRVVSDLSEKPPAPEPPGTGVRGLPARHAPGGLPLPHFANPFFRQDRGLWYVQIHGKQHNLGRDQDSAFRKYHDLIPSRWHHNLSSASSRDSSTGAPSIALLVPTRATAGTSSAL